MICRRQSFHPRKYASRSFGYFQNPRSQAECGRWNAECGINSLLIPHSTFRIQLEAVFIEFALLFTIKHMRPNWFIRFINRLRGRDPVKEYYAWLVKFGRITEGRILDFQQDDTGTTIFYSYQIANVDYETSQKLTFEQLSRRRVYTPGASITVRFDPKNPGSSIVP